MSNMVNKPLPHRPFSVAGNPNPERSPKPRRQHQPQMTSVSSIRPYVPVNEKVTISPVPKRAHLVTRSPSPPYYHHHAATSDALPSSRPKPSHSFSESQSRSIPNASTSDLVPPHLRPAHTASFWRRHWFVILICILAVLGISVAVVVVLRGSRSAGVYTPTSFDPSEAVSEAPIGTVSQGSATSQVPSTSSRSSRTSTSASATSSSATGGPLPSAARTNPS